MEFRHLISSGHLINVPGSEIDDCYTQIDKDGSGGIDFDEFFSWFLYEFSHEKHHGKKDGFKIANIIPAKQRAMRRLLPKFVGGELEDDFGGKVPKPGQGVITVDGVDDRWWLDDLEKHREPYGHYLKRIQGTKLLEEKRKKAEKEAEEEAARQKEANMTHEEKVERRKEREADKEKKVAEMKRKMAERKRKEAEEAAKLKAEEEAKAEMMKDPHNVADMREKLDSRVDHKEDGEEGGM